MLPFQNTTLYKKTLSVFEELIEIFEKNILFSNKIEEETLTLSSELAKALSKEHSDEREKALQTLKENFSGLFVFLERAEKQQIISRSQYESLSQKINDLQNDLTHFSQTQKRILILSANAGQGHMSAAKAVKEGVEYLYGYDFRVEIVDFGEILSSTINKAGIKAYEGSIKYMPSLYEFVFETTNQSWQIKLLNLLNYPLSFKKLSKFFADQQPDLILSTHPLWDYVALKVWKKQNPNAKFLSIITDSIEVHKAWVVADTDYHIVPNEDTALTLREHGIKTAKIKILGFPVKLDFLQKTDRKTFLESFDLDPKLFTIVFLATSESKQKAITTIEALLALQKPLNLVIITGRNLSLKLKLAKFEKEPNVRIFGWTDRLADFIKSSDIVVTKAGGATVTECIAAQKPMLITQIVPGQERGNAELIERHHLGIVLSSQKTDITTSIEEIEKKHSFFEKNLAELSKPEAALDIAKFIRSIL